MSEPRLASAFGSWQVPAAALTIECSLDVIEQIRAAALVGLRQLSRGGLEVAGILLGEHGAHAIRILSWRPMSCEHGRGPAFLLTDHDRAENANLLMTLADESSRTGSQPLGWFVSHTRTAPAMSDSDLEIYRQLFPRAWQITLVLNPSSDGTARASFFIRDPTGQIGSTSPEAFTISPAPRLNGRPGGLRVPATPNPAPTPHPPVEKSPVKPRDSRRAAARRALFDRRIWIWLVPALLALVVLSTMIDRDAGLRRGFSKPAGFGFRAGDVGGALRLEWNRNSDTIRDATRASLEIRDGKVTIPIALDADRLREGSFNYARKSADLELRMTVYPATGAPVQEFTKFVGAPAAQRISSAEASTLRRERDKLKAEAQQLRESLRKENARNRQLEQTVRILEQRVQVEKLRSAKR